MVHELQTDNVLKKKKLKKLNELNRKYPGRLQKRALKNFS